MFRLEDGRECLYQWDSERRLIVSDKTISHVHYCNKTDDCSLVVETYEENGLLMADIPNILLQTDWPIRVYGYCGGRFTKQHIVLKVIKRSRPADYIYTETEILRWHTVEEEIKAEMAALDKKVNDEIAAARVEFGNSYANAIRGYLSGKPALAAKNVSPAPHKLQISTTPNGTVAVSNSKNLLDYTKAVAYRGSLEIIDGGVRWKKGGTYYFSIPCELPKGITIAGSFTDNGADTDAINNMRVKYKSGGSNNIAVIYNSLTLTDDVEAIYIYKNSPGTALTADVDITNICLEIGTGASGYEEYAEPITYTANEEGVVEGVVSHYPSMSFIGKDAGGKWANVSVRYNRDLEKALNELQNAMISLGGNV